MATETELKLAIEPLDISKFLEHPMVASAKSSSRKIHLQGTYFDTPDHKLSSQKISLRVRREGERWIQAIKSVKNNTGSIHLRHEWESEVEEERPELDKLPIEIKQNIFADSHFCKSIVPVFNVNIERTLWDLISQDGSKIELCLDQGNVRTATASEYICEIELELKSGNTISLYETALNLLDTIPLQIENKTKAQRGFELLDPIPVTFHKSEILSLSKSMSVEEVFIGCIQNCIEHIQENEAITLHGGEPEGVHQIRVALRRLRSALTFFKPLVPVDSYQEIRQQIRWLCDLMGPVRDWDVFILSLEDMLKNNPDNSNIQQILLDIHHHGCTERKRHSDTLIQSMQSAQYTRLFLSLSLWLQHRPWRKHLNNKQLKKLEGPIKHFANKRLRKIHNKLLSRGGDAPSQLTPEQRHKVRIKSKELAYSLRFVSSLYSEAETYLELLSNLRDDLGMLNDKHTAQGLLKTPSLVHLHKAAYDYFLGWFSAHEAIALNNLDKNWPVFLIQQDITK